MTLRMVRLKHVRFKRGGLSEKPITVEGSYNSMDVFHPGLTCDVHFRGAFSLSQTLWIFLSYFIRHLDLMSSMIQ